MKLQKLCYYCQAWHLAKSGQPLFKEDFARWDYGPVCRELFSQHRKMLYITESDIDTSLCSFVDLPVEIKNMYA
jgi:uncharacterized phage-associated protein